MTVARENNKPDIAVVIPTKNRGHLIAETLESVQRQTLRTWEAIVVDDGSTDGTAEVMARFTAGDARIRYAQRQSAQAGAPVCRNEGFAATTSRLVVFLDSDDLLAPTCLEGRVAAMEAHADIDFAVCQVEVFVKRPGDTGTYWNTFTAEDDLDRFLRSDAPFATPSVTWRRAAFERAGRWRAGLVAWQDFELHVRALACGLRYRKIAVADCLYRRGHGAAISDGEAAVEQLRNFADVLNCAVEALRRHGQLLPHRVELLRGLYLQRIDFLLFHRQLRLALGLWRHARAQGLVSWARFMEAAAWMAARCVPRAPDAIRAAMWARFPERKLIDAPNRNVARQIATEDAVNVAPIPGAAAMESAKP